MKIKTNDMVVVLQGRDKDKRGKVVRVLRNENRVVVEKLNTVKKHLKPTQTQPQGGIQEIALPLPVSRVMLVCPHCDKPTRIGHTLSNDKKNVRICKKCNQVID